MSAGRKLNMQHGFIKFIQRHQIQSDELFKLEEARKVVLRKTFGLENGEGKTQKRQRNTKRNANETTTDGKKTYALRSESLLVNEREEDILRDGVKKRFGSRRNSTDEINSLCNALSSQAQIKPTKKRRVLEITFSFESGRTETCDITNDIQAARTAKMLTRKYGFNENQCQKLRIFIEELFGDVPKK